MGDSFTYGDEVSDEETWPAQLQKFTGRRVMNGGVTGYGFDQIILRTEQLCAKHRPSVIIVGFIEDDIRRTEMRRIWWRDKPWFAIEDDQLVLKGVPVPSRTGPSPWLRRHTEEVVAGLPPFLQHRLGYHSPVHPAGQGLVIAQRLTERLARLRADNAVKIVVMAQYPPVVWHDPTVASMQRRAVQTILDSAASHGLATLDTFRRLAAEPKPLNFYGSAPGSSHMNARGNSMIASLLAATLPALLKHQKAP